MGYFLSIYFHIFVASLWLGSNFFIIILIQVLSSNPNFFSLKYDLLEKVTLRMRGYTYIVFLLLFLTGFGNLLTSGIGLDELRYFFLHGRHGMILSLKLFLFSTIFFLSFYHDFILGPRVFDLIRTEGPEIYNESDVRKRTILLGRINMALTIIVFTLGIYLSTMNKF